MAAQTSGSRPSRSTPKPGRSLKWWFSWLLVLLVLAAVGALGWRQFREFRKDRMVARARALIEAKDYPQAMMSARRALQLNPRDAAVARIMVELAESVKTKEALVWYRLLSELEPGKAETEIAWADCALRFREQAIANSALDRVNEAGRKTARYQDAAGRLAEMGNQLDKAEGHFLEAIKLDPANVKYQVRLAALRLRGTREDQYAEAREVLEKHGNDPEVRDVASRALLTDLFRRKEWVQALTLAKAVQEPPNATFADRMLYLGLLRQFKRPEFHGYLLTLQEIAIASPDDTATLLNWMAENTLVMLAVSWSKTLPVALATQMPVPAAIGECYANLHDWEALRGLVIDANWQYGEFLRFAFLSRVQRESGDLTSSRNAWNNAIKAAGSRTVELYVLIRYAEKWGWENELMDLLWAVARGSTGQQEALAALYKHYADIGNTRGLLNVSTRMLEINPRDPVALNNFTLLSLLLNVNLERAQKLADQAFQLEPKNYAIASTYAYSLHLRGRTDEAIKIIRELDEKHLSDPSIAAYLAAMLVETEKPEDAAKFIEIAQTGKLLPEEMEMVKVAREALIRHNANKPPPQ